MITYLFNMCLFLLNGFQLIYVESAAGTGRPVE